MTGGRWVYILICADDRYYVGSTSLLDIDERVWQHNHRPVPGSFTSRRLPVTLAWADHFDRHDEAAEWERRLKGWSRVKKAALISGDEDRLPALSRRGYRPTRDG